MYQNIFHPVACCEQGINIARIAKAALHKLPGKSSLNVWSVFPGCPGFPVYTDDYDDEDPDDHDGHD